MLKQNSVSEYHQKISATVMVYVTLGNFRNAKLYNNLPVNNIMKSKSKLIFESSYDQKY